MAIRAAEHRETNETDIAFFAEMAGENALQVVMKAAIYIEHEIRVLLNVALIHPKPLHDLELTYAQLAGVAVAIGLPERFSKPLKCLGTIRNRFAHRKDAVFGKTDADSIYGVLDQFDREVAQRQYQSVRASRTENASLPDHFRKLPPIDQFRLYAVTIRSAIIAAQHHAERARATV